MSEKLLTAQKLTYSVETTHLQSSTKKLFLINEKYSKNKEHMYQDGITPKPKKTQPTRRHSSGLRILEPS